MQESSILLKDTSEKDNENYISFGSKYNKFLQDCFFKKNPSVSSKKFMVLSGEAGSGKTSLIHHEFIKKFEDYDIQHLVFRFLPEENLHNFLFLEKLSLQLADLLKRNQNNLYDNRKKYLEDLRSLQEISNFSKIENKTPFDRIQKYKKFISILNHFASNFNTVVIFEDIDFANSLFEEYLSYLTDNYNDLHFYTFFSNRNERQVPKKFNSKNCKFFHIPKLSDSSVKKYLLLFKDKNGIKNQFFEDQNIIGLSEHNPFYIQELVLLKEEKEKEKEKEKKNSIVIDFQALRDGRESILKIRYEYLPDNLKYLLAVLSSVGFATDKTLLSKLVPSLKVKELKHDLEALETKKFIKIERTTIRFYHNLTYEILRNITPKDILKGIDHELYHLVKTKKEIQLYDKVINISINIGQHATALYCAKKLAKHFYKKSEHVTAQGYYEIALEIIKLASSPSRALSRTIDIIAEYHMSCLLSGDSKKSKSLIQYLLNISHDLPYESQYKLYTALCTSYWTIGEISEALNYAEKTKKIADLLQKRDYIYASNLRFGVISLELGYFRQALKTHRVILNQIQNNEFSSTFGMLVEAYPAGQSILALCEFELGNIQDSKNHLHEAYKYFKISNHNFTKIYISLHGGFCAFLSGEYDLALEHLNQTLKFEKTDKITLLVPAALALAGICNIYAGKRNLGLELIQRANSLTNQTFKGSKKGIIDLSYIESLLLTFNTQDFTSIVDQRIKELQAMNQISFVAWLYFYNAIYYAFYSNSPIGFVGSFAKSMAIAQSLEMNSLVWNLENLARLEKSGLITFSPQPEERKKQAFNKALYFYNLTKNTDTIFPYRIRKSVIKTA